MKSNKSTYYDILGLKSSATAQDIKDQYKLLAKKHHPDHNGDPKMFAAITKAYQCLSNPTKRQEYDKQLNIQTYRELNDFKKGFADFINVQNNNKVDLKTASSIYKTESEKMNEKHGIKPKTDIPLTDIESSKRVSDLTFAREQEDIETLQDKIFDDNKIDIKIFNALFESHRKQISSNELVNINPDTFNINTKGSSFDNSFVNLYDEETVPSSNVYSKLETEENVTLTKEQIDKFKNTYKHRTNNKEEESNIENELMTRLKERESFNMQLDERKINDFDNIIFNERSQEYDNLDEICDTIKLRQLIKHQE